MRLTRVFVPDALSPGAEIALPDGAAAHLTRVLRLGVGDACIVFNGDGHDYTASIATVGKREARLRIGEATPVEREAPLRLVLGLLGLVTVGTVALMLPGMATRPLTWSEALFTATSARSASSPAWPRAQAETCAPAPANASAISRPMPLLPPATSTRRPLKSRVGAPLGIRPTAMAETFAITGRT